MSFALTKSSILVLILLLGCASTTPGPEPDSERDVRTPDPLFGLGERDSFVMSSNLIGRDFHILVRLPRSYDESDREYPMTLLLDGGILFPMLSPYQLMLEAEGSAGEVIVVGVSYGGLGFSNGNFRSTDYTAPSPVVDYFGGAEAYQDFLATELLPRLQRDYRIDPNRRMLFGQSLGGQFAIHAALTRPELFSTYVAINPAIHSNLEYFFALEVAPDALPTTLVMAMGSEDDPRYREPALEWLAQRQLVDNARLLIERLDLSGAHHATSAPPAYGAVVRDRVPVEGD